MQFVLLNRAGMKDWRSHGVVPVSTEHDPYCMPALYPRNGSCGKMVF